MSETINEPSPSVLRYLWEHFAFAELWFQRQITILFEEHEPDAGVPTTLFCLATAGMALILAVIWEPTLASTLIAVGVATFVSLSFAPYLFLARSRAIDAADLQQQRRIIRAIELRWDQVRAVRREQYAEEAVRLAAFQAENRRLLNEKMKQERDAQEAYWAGVRAKEEERKAKEALQTDAERAAVQANFRLKLISTFLGIIAFGVVVIASIVYKAYRDNERAKVELERQIDLQIQRDLNRLFR